MITINPSAGKEETQLQEDKIQKMQNSISMFFNHLMIKHDQFNAEKAFDELQDYVKLYDRILYSPISNIIYSSYENGQSDDLIGTLLSNLDELLSYSNDSSVIAIKITALRDPKDKKYVEDTRKAIFKIWDHVNLANQQYKVLKQSDDEYDEKFKARISNYKEEMTKEMNAQLLTMVSIFTALAFLIFGGISSLDNIFSISGVPLLKVISSGLVWGLCILNLIFVFLFCVGKMTNLNFKSTDNPDATIFQKYPIVWWSDMLLVSLLLICMWIYFIQEKDINLWFINICMKYTVLSSVIGSIIIAGLIIIVGRKLALATGIIKRKK